MKNIKYPLIAVGLIFLAYCKTTKKAETTPTPPPAPVVVKPSFTPSDKQLEAANKRWPTTTVSEIQEGQAIYTGKCASCHMLYDIMEFGEKKWIHEIEKMSPKARLTEEEKLKMSKHILSFREANSVVKPN